MREVREVRGVREVREVRGKGEFGADDRADAGGERSTMKARCAIDAVAIEERHCRVSVTSCLVDERFRKRRGF